MRIVLSFLFVLLAGIVATDTRAHELWISPDRYTVKPGEKISANVRVGEKLEGPASSYLPRDFARFDVIHGGTTLPVTGRTGDLPALAITISDAGLAVVVYVSSGTTLAYQKWEKFTGFVKHKNFPGVLDRHKARGLPEAGFVEFYQRFAKSLIAVGHGKGADRIAGLETEIVALANPYTDDLSTGLPIRVLYNGKPRQGAQVEVFARAPDNTVKVSFFNTDDNGHVTVPVAPNTEYLIDAVVMRERAGDIAKKEPVWDSLWASLTFKTGAILSP